MDEKDVGIAIVHQPTDASHEIDPEHTLPPLRLRDAHMRHRWLTILAFYILAGGSIGIIVGSYYVFSQQIKTIENQSNPCETITASGSERWFVVDIQSIANLSFAQAKMLDLAWDAFVGQVGRLLHGGIFYYVVVRVVTWMCERHATSYDFYIDMMFSSSSPQALWTAGSFVFRKEKPIQLTMLAIWAFISIVYLLVFPIVWGASTGYFARSMTGVEIPSADGYGNYITKESESYNFCWVADLSRLNPDHSGVVTGPNLHELNIEMTLNGDFEEMWESFPYFIETENLSLIVSDEFKSLYTYALSTQTIATFSQNVTSELDLTSSSTSRESSYSEANLELWLEPKNCDAVPSTRGMAFSDESACMTYQSYELQDDFFATVIGWQFVDSTLLGPHNITQSTYSSASGTPAESWNTTAMVLDLEVEIYQQTFHLNESVLSSQDRDSSYSKDTKAPPPYNSTLWWHGSPIPLAAPHLDIGALPPAYTSGTSSSTDSNSTPTTEPPPRCDTLVPSPALPICLCHHSTPITTGFPLPVDELVCVSSQDSYVWGFASHMAVLGVILEVIWLWACGAAWLATGPPNTSHDAAGELARYGREGSGTVRGALDLAGAVKGELGDRLGAYGENRLRGELRGRRACVGFVVLEDEEEGEKGGGDDGAVDRMGRGGRSGCGAGGGKWIKLQSVDRDLRVKRRLKMDERTLYS